MLDGLSMMTGRLSQHLLAMLAVLALLVPSPAAAQQADPPAARPALKEAPDAKELERFVDGYVRGAMAEHRIPGAVVAVVSPSETLFVRGFGLANADTQERVDAQKHLFRIASISKTFTATAIMQLVEQGKVDLDADIRTYLGDLEFDDSLGPIKVRHLLVHAPGFEDLVLGYYGDVGALAEKDQAQQIAALAPRQVYPPGKVSAYSNFGYALLGEIISRVSGQSYSEYIESQLLEPLAMERTAVSIRSTPAGKGNARTEKLRSDEARAHVWDGGWFEMRTFPGSLPLLEPEGGLASTAQDMARWMRFHLNRGELDDVRLLKEDTATRMRTLLASNTDQAAGNAHGFWYTAINGYDVFGHGGSINNFRSRLVLIPELGLGIFVSTNAESGEQLSKLPKRLIEHFFPSDEPLFDKSESDAGKIDLSRFEGKYLGARRSHTTIAKLFGAASPFSIRRTSDGGQLLVIEEDGSTLYQPIDDGLFQAPETGEIMRFDDSDSDLGTRVFFSGSPSNTYERVTFETDLNTLLLPAGLAALAALIVLYTTFVRPIFVRPQAGYMAHAIARMPHVIAGALALAVFVQGFQFVNGYASDLAKFYEVFPTPQANTLLWASLAFGAASVFAALVTLYRALVKRSQRIRSLLLDGALSAAFLAFTWSLYHWNVFTI